MSKHGKRLESAYEGVDRDTALPVDEAVRMLKERATAKFDETVELHFSLGIDPRHADQLVRGTLTLPNGSGKDVRIIVVTDDENTAPILEAGAIDCGLDDLLKKISDGWLDFDLIRY